MRPGARPAKEGGGPVVCIHQPCYYPWLGLLDKIARSDVFVVLDNVQINKRAFQHRTMIRTAGGWQWLTVPVSSKGHQVDRLLLKDVRIDTDRGFRRKHHAAFLHNYRKAPFWEDHEPFFRETYECREWEFLLDLDMATLRHTLDRLGLEREVVLASELGARGAKSGLILEICRAVGARAYLSGTGAREYLDEASFEKAGIPVLYQEFTHPVYPQVQGGFVEGMGGIDLLLNCGPGSLDHMEAPR